MSSALTYNTIDSAQEYDIHQASAELKVSRTMLAKLASRGKLPYRKNNGRYLFLGKDLQKLAISLEEGRQHIAELFSKENFFLEQALDEIERRL